MTIRLLLRCQIERLLVGGTEKRQETGESIRPKVPEKKKVKAEEVDEERDNETSSSKFATPVGRS